MSIVLVGSTSGSVTLQEPAIAGSTVLTLPAVSGTVLTTASPKAGNVLQVVQAITQTSTSTSSTSYVTTSVSGSITPATTSNKILVQVFLGTSYASSGGVTGTVTIYRNASTDLAATSQGFALSSSVGNLPVAFAYLDSPSSTSSTTYTVYMKTNSGTFYVGGTNGGVAVSNSITLTEIAG